MAILLPVTTDWCRRHRVSPAKLLLPLNYMKMLGAMCCMLGTTSNLVVAALMHQSKHPGIHPLGLFDIAYVGLPCAVIGVGYILFAGIRLLPDRSPGVSEKNAIREYSVSVCVERGGPLDGKSIAEAGLRSLPGLYLIEIERPAELITAVGPSVVLRADDRLTFVGDLDSVVDLRKMRGLASEDRQREKLSVPPPGADVSGESPRETGTHSKERERVLIVAVVSPECPLVGKSVREGRFRAHYGAAIVAIARGAQRLTGKIGDIVLQVGDTLVLETRPAFLERARRNRDFFVASKVEGFVAPKTDKAILSIAILVGMVAATTLLEAPFFLATSMAASAMVLTGCLNVSGARAAVEWRVIITIGASFALGEALRTSGAASSVAGALVGAIGAHPQVALASVFVLTALAAELVTHTAAATLMFPLALASADRLGVSPMPFAIIVLIGASCSFMTPFGYQTNLMIMGPGGYEFADYVRFGSPLTVLVGCVAVTMAPLVWPFG
jgi:di/tricarboxylate transporter